MESLEIEVFEQLLKEYNIRIIPNDQVAKENCIGEGGFGKVYKGSYLDKEVAIKKIKLEDESGDKIGVYKEIINEVKVVLKADHPNIPKFYGIWVNKAHFHLIFEFIEGKSWRYCYEAMDKKTKLEILSNLCGTLKEFHKKKLIHRDIKPDNVMIEKDNKPRLIDFGVSKIASKTATFTKVQMGTIPYMAPEMFLFDEEQFDPNDKDAKPVPVSTYSDIWSFGCMISEVFSGIKPWHKKKDQNLTETYIQSKFIRQEQFPIPSGVDDDVKVLIIKCCNYQYTERPQAGDLQEMIDKLIASLE